MAVGFFPASGLPARASDLPGPPASQGGLWVSREERPRPLHPAVALRLPPLRPGPEGEPRRAPRGGVVLLLSLEDIERFGKGGGARLAPLRLQPKACEVVEARSQDPRRARRPGLGDRPLQVRLRLIKAGELDEGSAQPRAHLGDVESAPLPLEQAEGPP